MSENTSAPKKRRWWHNVTDAYKVTKRSYPWMPAAMFGSLAGSIILGILIGYFTHHLVTGIILGILIGITIPMGLLSYYLPKASYKQIEGIPGATAAVLDNLGRNWHTSTTPVRFNKNQDFVWRVVGRPGVILVAEGPTSRVGKLVAQERATIHRITGKEVPIQTIYVGDGTDKTTKLADLSKTLKKLPKTITAADVSSLITRLERVQARTLLDNMPKGMDLSNPRGSRRALRG